MRDLLRSPAPKDRGATLVEFLIGSAIAMIAFLVLATLLAATQRQQRSQTLISDAIGTARNAMTQVADEVRGAKWIDASGSDAVAWLDTNKDGVRDPNEEATFRVRTLGGITELVRIRNGTTTLLATGLQSGTLTVTTGKNAAELTIALTLPGVDGKAATSISSKVSTRANG